MPAGDGAAGGPGARSSEHGAANAAEVEMPKEQVLSLLQVLSLHGAAKLVVRNTPVPNSTPTTLNYVSLYHSKTGVTPALESALSLPVLRVLLRCSGGRCPDDPSARLQTAPTAPAGDGELLPSVLTLPSVRPVPPASALAAGALRVALRTNRAERVLLAAGKPLAALAVCCGLSWRAAWRRPPSLASARCSTACSSPAPAPPPRPRAASSSRTRYESQRLPQDVLRCLLPA